MINFKKLFYLKILKYTLLILVIFPDISYGQIDTLRVQIGCYARIRDYIKQAVLIQHVFSDRFLKIFFSETGIKVRYIGKYCTLESIDLSLPGINDSIAIKFAERTDEMLAHKSFIRIGHDEKIVYIIAEDIKFNEARYLLNDMMFVLKKYDNRLTLSDTFSLRLKNLAVYLARNMDLSAVSGAKLYILKKEIESLYLLGIMLDTFNIANPGKLITPFEFEEIKNKKYFYETAILDYMKSNNIFIGLTARNADEFMKNIEKLMMKESIVAMRLNISSVLFSRGAEKLFLGLEAPDKKLFLKIKGKLAKYLKFLQKGAMSGLLKDNISIEDWKNRLVNASEEEEVKIVKEILKTVDKYRGWKDKRGIDYMIKYAISKKELNCLTRSVLLSRILREIGVEKDRLYSVSFPEHVFLMMKLKSGEYLEIQTSGKAFEHTRILPEEIKTELDMAIEKVKLLGSARLALKKPLWEGLPQTRDLTILNNLEGIIEKFYYNLALLFYEARLNKKQKRDVHEMRTILMLEALRINPDETHAFFWDSSLNNFIGYSSAIRNAL